MPAGGVATATRALELYRDLGDGPAEASTVYQLGVLQYYLDGQPGRAAPPLRQALAIYQKFGSPHAPRVEELVRSHDL